MVMVTEMEHKKESNGHEETDSNIKDCMLPHVMTDFMDHKKQALGCGGGCGFTNRSGGL